MIGNFEVVTLCPWYLMPNSSHLKLKSPMFIVALFMEATARAFHYRGVECAVKHCQKWVLCLRGYDRQLFSMVSYKYDFPKVLQKNHGNISQSISQGTQQSRWHVPTQWRSTVQEKSRSHLDPTVELCAAWRNRVAQQNRATAPISLSSLSSLVTINPPQTDRNPICSNK